MTISFQFFADAGLTQPLANLAVTRPVAGGLPAAVRIVYLGSPDAGKILQASSSPGVDPVVVNIASFGQGIIIPSYITLALSSEGLDTATPGAPITLPETLQSGVANAIAIYVRVTTPELPTGEFTEVRLITDEVQETVL